MSRIHEALKKAAEERSAQTVNRAASDLVDLSIREEIAEKPPVNRQTEARPRISEKADPGQAAIRGVCETLHAREVEGGFRRQSLFRAYGQFGRRREIPDLALAALPDCVGATLETNSDHEQHSRRRQNLCGSQFSAVVYPAGKPPGSAD